MCGIAGYWGKKFISDTTIIRTLELMKSRGPDVQRYKHFEIDSKNILLLHSRLSIIDLKERSNQPFTKDRLTIIFNGEIYNYLELKERVKHKCKFLTNSDTEVILEYYKLYGEKCLDYFEGMWSFAIYDNLENQLFISRDRFGEKPLYLHFDKSNLYFGSEIKFISSLKNEALPINFRLVEKFLRNGYKTIFKRNETFFKNIIRVENATAIIIKNGEIKKKFKYWKPHFIENKKLQLTEAIEDCKNLIINSLKIRLRSDVPLAFCLSGGIDSSSLVSVARKYFNYKVKGFSIIDEDPRYNELKNIKNIVSDLNCENELIKITKIDFFKRLKKLINYHDSPVSTISYFIHSLISEIASKQGYKVIVSGTGADELFTGYYDHYLFQLREIKNSEYFNKNFDEWKRYISKNIRNPKLKDFSIFLKNKPPTDHIFDSVDDKNKIFLNNNDDDSFEEEYFSTNNLKNRMLNELFFEIIPVILHEDDMNSMMHSMENRSPFLDRKLFEFAYSCPSHFHIKNGYNKYLLRQSMKNILNEKVRIDRVKKGFNCSIESIVDFEGDEMKDFIFDKHSSIYNIVRYDEMKKKISKIKKHTVSNKDSKFYFAFISSKLFLDQFH
tara:strand:- start:4584 stop:6419 length:1836 start_codon:yes stop_codon:yes gene_type:complete